MKRVQHWIPQWPMNTQRLQMRKMMRDYGILQLLGLSKRRITWVTSQYFSGQCGFFPQMDSNTSTTHTSTKPWPCRSTDLGPGAHSLIKEEGRWWLYGSRVWLHTLHMPWADGQLSLHLLTQWIPGMDCSIQASCKYCRQESWMDGEMVTWVDTKFCKRSKKPAQTWVWQIHLINLGGWRFGTRNLPAPTVKR